MESMMKMVVKEVDSQNRSDKMFLEMEEKCIKFEAEQRKEEREFQMRMMAMLCGRPSSHPSLPHRPQTPGVYDPSLPHHPQTLVRMILMDDLTLTINITVY